MSKQYSWKNLTKILFKMVDENNISIYYEYKATKIEHQCPICNLDYSGDINACFTMLKRRKDKSEFKFDINYFNGEKICQECNGTGILDFGFYSRKCMKCFKE